MIHNFVEERKNLSRHDASGPTPLTDEELAWLMEAVEERELLHAPAHLKGDIISRIQTERRRERERSLFSYRVKVLAGMAAALTVLFLVPVDGVEKGDVPQSGIWRVLREEEAPDADAWEKDALERQRDIEETWERYQAGQERADARRKYFRELSEKLKNDRNDVKWED